MIPETLSHTPSPRSHPSPPFGRIPLSIVNVLERLEIGAGSNPVSEPFNCARSWGVRELKFVVDDDAIYDFNRLDNGFLHRIDPEIHRVHRYEFGVRTLLANFLSKRLIQPQVALSAAPFRDRARQSIVPLEDPIRQPPSR